MDMIAYFLATFRELVAKLIYLALFPLNLSRALGGHFSDFTGRKCYKPASALDLLKVAALVALNINFMVGLIAFRLQVSAHLCFPLAFHVPGNFGLNIGILFGWTSPANGVLLGPRLDIID